MMRSKNARLRSRSSSAAHALGHVFMDRDPAAVRHEAIDDVYRSAVGNSHDLVRHLIADEILVDIVVDIAFERAVCGARPSSSRIVQPGFTASGDRRYIST